MRKWAIPMRTEIPEQYLLRVSEVAAVLRVHRDTVLDLMHERELFGVMVGARWRIYRTSVVDYLARQERKAKALTATA
jgi:excisionase family DNA binding protein